MSLYVLSLHFVDTRSHDIGDMMSRGFVDTVLAGGSVMVGGMTNALSPRVRAMIINYTIVNRLASRARTINLGVIDMRRLHAEEARDANDHWE